MWINSKLGVKINQFFICWSTVCGNCRWPSVWLWEAVYLRWGTSQAANTGQPQCAGDKRYRQCPGTKHSSDDCFVIEMWMLNFWPTHELDVLTLAKKLLVHDKAHPVIVMFCTSFSKDSVEFSALGLDSNYKSTFSIISRTRAATLSYCICLNFNICLF